MMLAREGLAAAAAVRAASQKQTSLGIIHMPIHKRIVIQDYAGYPFPVQLSRRLAARGHTVLHLYAGRNRMPGGQMQALVTDPSTFNVRGLNTRQPLEKYAFVKRWFQEREYGRLTLQAVKEFSPDVVISADMPLDPQSMLSKHCRQHHIRFIFWLQDIISLATKNILAKKLSAPGAWIGDYYLALEKNILRQSDHVVSITEDFNTYLLKAGVTPEKVSVIPNWAPLEALPVLPKDNDWARAHGLADKFCFLYSGTLGLKHKPDLLLQLALSFRDEPQVVVYVGSEGPGAEWLQRRKQEYNLTNLALMGYQPFDLLPQVQAAADVLVAVLDPDAGIYSVPSKVLSYLAAQRPVLLAVPEENLAARIVQDNQAGWVVNPANHAEWLEKAHQLFRTPSLRQVFGSNARRYAEANFDIETIADRFEALLDGAESLRFHPDTKTIKKSGHPL